ncbi:MAG: TetR/AcrR family transcriptional regulator [Nevskiales bacterium]|nr:TetR/AcrR family transcriptional regulator [Nevskiales bacterium]
MQGIDIKVKKIPKQARAQATYKAMLDATAQILSEEGYAAVTTNRVAETAGVSIGSLYEYFPNKQSIVAAAIGRALRAVVLEVSDGLRMALKQRSERSAVHYWIRAMTEALQCRADLLRVALREVPFLWQIPEMHNLSDALLDVARRGRERIAHRVRFDDPEASTYLLTTMVWSAILQYVLYPPQQLSRDRLTETLVDMVLKLF